ncbi:MAG: cobalamin-dependent protein, partial [Myxococcota bacterium]|nr:cobalamin-dependent protein [Myxococcota bacterium]
MRILLVQPTPFEDQRLGLENTFWMSEPVALTSVAAMVPEHEVRVLDMRLEQGHVLAQVLTEFRPQVVGTTAMTTDAYQSLAVLRLARELAPEALTMVGGHHATMMSEFYHRPFVDVVVKGEGEQTFRTMIEAWQDQGFDHGGHDASCLESIGGIEVQVEPGRWVDTGKAEWLHLDSLPAPARHLLDSYRGQYFFLAGRPMAAIFTSRGCSFDCNFCAIWEFYDRKTRYLSAEKIVDRMEDCSEPFIFFLDDNFLSRTDRLEALCD